MSSGVRLATLVLLGVLVLSTLTFIQGGYCPRSYYASVKTAQIYSVKCHWWSRCTKTRYIYEAERRVDDTACCANYRGQSCDVPICDPPCRNRGICVSPNRCECPGGFVGGSCNVESCSWRKDCYPGICSSNTCVCSSEFYGTNCQNMRDGPIFSRCGARLVTKSSGRTTTLQEEQCTDDVIYASHHSNASHVVFEYEVSYPRLKDLPQPPSGGYLRLFRVGVVQTYADVILKNQVGREVSRARAACVTSAAQMNPQELIPCSMNSALALLRPRHQYRLELRIYGQTGGYKEIRNEDTPGVYEKREITGRHSTRSVVFQFDLQAPSHCTQGTCPSGRGPVEVFPDVTKTKHVLVGFFGWSDPDSGIANILFDLYAMALNPQGQLEETGDSLYAGRWEASSSLIISNLTLPSPGLFSIIARVTDNANNTAYARGLVMYDPSSELTVTDQPLRVVGSSGLGHVFWVNTTQSTANADRNLILSWAGRYGNNFYSQNHLLAEVKPFTRGLDDNSGNRSQAAVPNVGGVVQFEYQVEQEVATTLARLSRSVSWNNVTPIADQLNLQLPRAAGDSFRFQLRATDVVGHVLTDTIYIRVDSSPPSVTLELITFTANTGYEAKSSYSRVNIPAEDLESGVARIEYTLYDTTSDKVLIARLQELGQTWSKGDCTANLTCKCTTFGECYPEIQMVHLHNCVLKDHMGKEILMEGHVVNQAELKQPFSIQLQDIKNLNGIGQYPAPSSVSIGRDWGDGVEVTWVLADSCYNVTSVRLMLSGGGINQDRSFSGLSNGTDISDLLPLYQYVLTVTVLYDRGSSSPSQLTFTTKESALPVQGDSTPGIIGSTVAIGGLLLIILIIIGLFFVRNRMKKRKLGKAKCALAEMDPSRARARNSYVPDDIPMEGNMAYAEAPRFACEEDDLYAYGDLETDPGAAWKHTQDKVILGRMLVVGKFADIKMATLISANDRTTLVAKALKAGSSEDDQLLMRAKMNFLAAGLQPHPNFVHFAGAVTEGTLAPLILLEFCDIGLRDWLEQQNWDSADLEDVLIAITLDVAKAMEALHEQEILHRRLGARNILLKKSGDQVVAKVMGFGPMKGEQGGKEKIGKERIPTKWMAPEQIGTLQKGETRVYTKKTDVWSYGVTIWEINSKGEIPYKEQSKKDIVTFIQSGGRLEQPLACSDRMYQGIISLCWAADPGARKGFPDIRSTLEKIFFGAGEGDDIYEDSVQTNSDYEMFQENVYCNNFVKC